jgi:hypothetical protein
MFGVVRPRLTYFTWNWLHQGVKVDALLLLRCGIIHCSIGQYCHRSLGLLGLNSDTLFVVAFTLDHSLLKMSCPKPPSHYI